MTTINNAVSGSVIQTVLPKKETQSKETKGISTTTKVVVGTGLAALATVGMYMLTKGKASVGMKPPVEMKPTLPEGLSHLDIDLFKQIGKFDKGKAFVNGKGFTGKIYTKNGCELSYSDGCLYMSKALGIPKDQGVIMQRMLAPRLVFEKVYSNSGNKLRCIEHKRPGNPYSVVIDRLSDGTRVSTKTYDRNLSVITTIKPNGEITRLTKGCKNYNTILQPYTYDKLKYLNTGKVEVTKTGLLPRFDRPIEIKRHKIVDGKKVTEVLNKKGEVTKSWVTEYDPKNKVFQQIITTKDGSTRVFPHKPKSKII